MMPARPPRERRRPYLKSGVYTLKKAVQTLGPGALPPKSTALGRALHEWRQALLADLGGVDTVSTQQLALVDLAMLLVNSLPAYVLSMPSPVNRLRRCLHPVVRERQALVNQLQSILGDLRLERRAKPVADLSATWRRGRLRRARSANAGHPRRPSCPRTPRRGTLTIKEMGDASSARSIPCTVNGGAPVRWTVA